MEKVRIGFVGLGQRGQGMLDTFLAYSVVDVVAVCDVYEDRIEKASAVIKEKRNHEPRKYLDFMKMLNDKDMDAIYIAAMFNSSDVAKLFVKYENFSRHTLSDRLLWKMPISDGCSI